MPLNPTEGQHTIHTGGKSGTYLFLMSHKNTTIASSKKQKQWIHKSANYLEFSAERLYEKVKKIRNIKAKMNVDMKLKMNMKMKMKMMKFIKLSNLFK